MNLDNYFSDPDGDELNYSVDYNNLEVLCSLSGSVLYINPVENWHGISDVTIGAEDTEIVISKSVKTGVSDSFSLTVSPVNDAPYVVTPIEAQYMQEDFEQFTIDLDNHFDDIDGDILSYQVMVNNQTEILCSIEGNLLHINSVVNWNGTSIVTLRATDNQTVKYASKGKLYTDETFSVVVSASNDIPFVELPIPDYVEDEDFESFSIDLNLYFTDPDGDNLIYDIESYNSENVDCNISGSILTVNSVENWFGSTLVSISAEDGNYKLRGKSKVGRELCLDEFEISVESVNDSPVIVSFEPEEDELTLDSVSEITFSVVAEDVDNAFEDLVFTWSINGEVINGEMSPWLTYTFDTNGVYNIEVAVTDGEYSVETSWTVTVNLVSINGDIIPEKTVLYQNYPNPFNPVTNIRYDISRASHVKVSIMDQRGAVVATLADRYHETGKYNLSWNGIDERGNTVSAGVYFFILKSDKENLMKRAVFIK